MPREGGDGDEWPVRQVDKSAGRGELWGGVGQGVEGLGEAVGS